MEFLMRGGEEFQLLYNCSFYNVSIVPLEQRINIPLGFTAIALTSIELFLYVPCLISIWNRRVHTFNKYMFVMGLLDILDLVIIGPISGFLTISGSVYCDHPTTMYILGCVLMGAAIGQHLMDLLLALNRCAYFVFPKMAMRVFQEQENWTWCWAFIPVAIAILYSTFGTPCIFSGVTGWWMWNPHYGYANELHELYAGSKWLSFFTFENWTMMVALPLIYFIFFVAVLWTKSKFEKQYKEPKKSSTTPIFKQVAVISIIQSAYAFFSIYLKHINGANTLLFPLHLFLSSQTCGIPPVIYLLYSKQIKKDVKQMLKPIAEKLIWMIMGD